MVNVMSSPWAKMNKFKNCLPNHTISLK